MSKERNYSKEEKENALAYYHKCGSNAKTRRILGYPSKSCLNNWIASEGKEAKPRVVRDNCKGNASFDEKMEAIYRCYELNEDIKLVAKELNRDVTTIRTWHRVYQKEGATALMKKHTKPKKKNAENITDDIESLKAQMLNLQLENDILRETIEVLKKDPGIDQTALKNREKAVIVDALKDKYSLPLLLKKLELSKSSYYYQEHSMKSPDKYAALRNQIREIFYNNKERYGYRRIWTLLTTGEEAITISEKVVRRIMKEEHLVAKRPNKKKYSSYQGEITPAVENKVNRNFHADEPNKLWLTDITEFAIPAGKVYLSPIVDCFDGMLVTWTIGTSPNANLVNSMLDSAIKTLDKNEHPIVHSDRGCHYRWPGWIERMDNANLIRSMSKKGCSPDNSACEGVFGRLKIEMFYGVDWSNVTINEFISILNEYLIWYNEERIKSTLNYMSPLTYRKSLGLIA